VFGPSLTDRGTLAEAVGLKADELDTRCPIQVVSTGVPFLIVPLRRRGSLERLAPDYRRLRPILHRLKVRYPYYLVTGEPETEARMFMETFEDPATGSAAGCGTSYLVRYGCRPPDRRFRIRQGRFVRRPSEIFAAASLQGEQVANVRIGGYVVEILRGKLML
jgi:PhzF family phenazine biosynthesis protein